VAWLTSLFSRTAAINLALVGITFALFILENWRRDIGLHDFQFFNGWSLVTCIVVMMLLTWRKKVVILPFGRVRFWLRVHYYVGFLTVAVFIVHTKYQLPGSLLHWLLWILFVLVSVSGLVGALISKILPPRLEAQGERILFDRIPLFRAQLAEQANAIARESVEDGNTRSIARLYVDTLSYFFAGPRNIVAHLAASKVPQSRLLDQLFAIERYLDDTGKDRLQKMRDLVEAKSNLDFHYINGGLLRLWLFVHVPATYALLMAIVLHVVLEYAFAAGTII
jgi:hypothetical protein